MLHLSRRDKVIKMWVVTREVAERLGESDIIINFKLPVWILRKRCIYRENGDMNNNVFINIHLVITEVYSFLSKLSRKSRVAFHTRPFHGHRLIPNTRESYNPVRFNRKYAILLSKLDPASISELFTCEEIVAIERGLRSKILVSC